MTKNKFAVALGKLGKGKKKTGLSDKERARRSKLAIANLSKINKKR
jgi:hypothetical protein